MANNDEITTIRISKSIKDELKNIALPQEPMGLTIQRLITENEMLKKLNEKNEDVIEYYKFKSSFKSFDFVKDEINKSNLDFKNQLDYVEYYSNLDSIFNANLSHDEKYAKLKDACDVIVDNIGADGLKQILQYLKITNFGIDESEYNLLIELEGDFEKGGLNG